MAGGTFEHDTITSNIGGLLYTQLRGTKCQVLTSNMKVRTRSNGLYSYPDVTVVCDKPDFHDSKRDVLTNPRVLIEVLSPSTEAFDKGEKRLLYQTIDSLQEYVLVAQDQPWVEHWSRRRDDQWLVSSLKKMSVELNLASIDCSLRLEEIYERVEFPG